MRAAVFLGVPDDARVRVSATEDEPEAMTDDEQGRAGVARTPGPR